MTSTSGGRRTPLARDRVRRLYCLECGEGTVQALPATGFVKTHKERHNIKESKVNDSFLVVERPAGDSTIKLDENLSSMFQKSFLEWSDEVVVADKYKERADRARAQRAGISVL